MKTEEELLNRYQELKDKSDVNSKFELLDIITNLQKDDLLDEFIEKNQSSLLLADPILLIGKHVHYFLCTDRFFEAKSVLKSYKDMSFISMEVEDFMKELDIAIEKFSKPRKHKDITEESLMEDLLSNNEDAIVSAMHTLMNSNVRQYVLVFKNVFLSELPYRYKILLLFILVEQKVDFEYKITKDDGSEFVFNAKDNILPFDKENFKKVEKYFDSLNESPSSINLAKEMLKMIEIKSYPESILESSYDPYSVAEVILFLVKTTIEENVQLEDLTSSSGLSMEECEDLLQKINTLVNY